jgi:glycosyltransferase involved in cell wall biosynthesis
MRPGLRIGIFDAYLSTLGGGENFLAVLAEFLESEYPRARIDLLTYAPYQIETARLEERFGVTLRRTRVRVIPSVPREHLARLGPLRRFYHETDVAEVSREYDLFINNTIYSLAPPRSRRSVYMCMFPLDPLPVVWRHQPWKRRFMLPYVLARKALYHYWMGRYDLMLANSTFTRRWIRRMWGVRAKVLYPPVETASRLSLRRKGGSILSIGRFFPGNHNKKHDVLIDAFVDLLEKGRLYGWQLNLVGGKTDHPGTEEYLAMLRRKAKGYPVHFHVDASRQTLQNLLETSSIFWHATGYGEDMSREPEKLEHFGLSTVEAMTFGCVPVVFDSGGQGEIVEHGTCGFLWRHLAELRDHTCHLVRYPALCQEIAKAAHQRSQRYSRRAFREEARRLLSEIVPPEERKVRAMEPNSARQALG